MSITLPDILFFIAQYVLICHSPSLQTASWRQRASSVTPVGSGDGWHLVAAASDETFRPKLNLVLASSSPVGGRCQCGFFGPDKQKTGRRGYFCVGAAILTEEDEPRSAISYI